MPNFVNSYETPSLLVSDLINAFRQHINELLKPSDLAQGLQAEVRKRNFKFKDSSLNVVRFEDLLLGPI